MPLLEFKDGSIFLYGLVLFTINISLRDPSVLVAITIVFPPVQELLYYLRIVADVEFVKILQDRDFRD